MVSLPRRETNYRFFKLVQLCLFSFLIFFLGLEITGWWFKTGPLFWDRDLKNNLFVAGVVFKYQNQCPCFAIRYWSYEIRVTA